MYNKSHTSKNSRNWAIILLFIVAASTLAIKINYFSPLQYQAVAQIYSEDKIAGNHPGILSVLMNHPLTLTPSYDAALRNAVIDATKNKDLNVEYFLAQPLLKTELFNRSPITVSSEIKNTTFYKQEFSFKYEYDNNFVLTYKIDGTIKEQSGEFGKEIQESNVKFVVNKKMIHSI